MILRRSGLLLTLLLSFLAVPLAAQVNDTYVIPVVGNTTGVGTSRWITEFHLFNPQAHRLTITLVFLPTHGVEGLRVDFDAEPNSTSFSDNILGDVFKVAGTGSLLVAALPEENPDVPDRVLDRAFLVNTRSFHAATNGTFGQLVRGVWTGLQDVDTDGITAIATGIRNEGNTITFTGYRTNIGALNLGRGNVTVFVSVYDSDGRTLQSNIPFEVPPQGHIQDRLPVEVDHGSVEFFVEDRFRDAVVFPYASVIDNRTNDAVYIEPILLASPGIIFPKMKPASEVGVKIDSAIARRIAASAQHQGKLGVMPTGRLTR